MPTFDHVFVSLYVLVVVGFFLVDFRGQFASAFVAKLSQSRLGSLPAKEGQAYVLSKLRTKTCRAATSMKDEMQEIPIPRHTIVFIRHGESVWNQDNIFTGWQDIDVTEAGVQEARAAGELMQRQGLEFDVVYTSMLKRAIKSAHHVTDAMGLGWIDMHKDWKLNEQMYGRLEGLNKVDCVQEHGLEQVQKWRRSYTDPPPARPGARGYFPEDDPKYAGLTNFDAPDSWCGTPGTESLKDTQARAWRLWREEIAPAVKAGKRVLVCAHGNTLRAFLRRLDDIPNDLLMQLDIPRATPLVYTLDEHLNPIQSTSSMYPLSGRFIGSMEELEAKVSKERTQCIPPPEKKPQRVKTAAFPDAETAGSYMCPGF